MPFERTVHVVDDDPAVRLSLERLLDTAGLGVVSYNTSNVFLEAAFSLVPGCALLDVRMPGMNGFELQVVLRQRNPLLPIIMLTGYGDVQSAVRAMKGGAVDFIEKPYNNDDLLNVIETALGRVEVAHLSRETAEAAERIATLSPREREVLAALVMGRPNKVIAFDLGISIRTVEVHRARMMERLGVRQFAEAIRIAILARLDF